MIRTIIGVDGMMCPMCESHIADQLRSAFPGAKKVSASRKKKEASFLSEEAPDETEVRDAIQATGYTFLSVRFEPYEKKSLFGW